MSRNTAEVKREVISSAEKDARRAITYAKWDLDDARESGDLLKIALAEDALNALLERYSCNT